MLKRIRYISRFSAPLDRAAVAAVGAQASHNNQNMLWAIERTVQHELRGAD
jgi:hypothetical protein